jgi:RNA polymerase sigma factor (sigma-70 family)
MIAGQEVVFVIDDDPSMRTALDSLLRSRGRRVETFASVIEFLGAGRADAQGCLVLDVRMPGTGGLELHDALQAEGHDLPVVFITGFGDLETGVRAMKSGAVDFLSKPFHEGDLLKAIDTAMARGAYARDQRERLRVLTKCYATLSARERQVFGRVAAGLLNKQIAAELGVSEKTVKVHRAHAMTKMRVRSVADLVRMSERLSGASNFGGSNLGASNASGGSAGGSNAQPRTVNPSAA